MTIAVRRAALADVSALQRIAELAYQKYVPRIGRPPAPMTADYPAQVAAGVVWVAVEDGDVVGLLVLHREADHAELENVAVAPAAQGRGVGAALMAHAEALATGWGLAEIRLYTNVAMAENLSYYPALGYRETGRGEQDGFQRVFFSKRLDASLPG